jgi:type II restriction enzyme
MALTEEQKSNIQAVIKTCLRRKFQSYKPGKTHMPFHARLLGKDRLALFSFIQSLNTTFGTSIFEPVAVELAKVKFTKAEAQYPVGNSISVKAQSEIQRIIDDLSIGKDANKLVEIERIRKVCCTGKMASVKTVKVDLFIQDEKDNIYLFDLKTAKPNKSNFKDFKRTLLEWTAITLATTPNAKIRSLIAIPYNPYEPSPYEIWTLKGMFDLKEELTVGEGFWDFLGGAGTYRDLLDCFEAAGIEMRDEIDAYFTRFKTYVSAPAKRVRKLK